MKWHAYRRQILGQDVIRETRLLLIQVDRNQLETNGRALLQFEQNVQHGIAVFAATDADHHLVAFFNHIEVHNRLADFAAQAFFQLEGLVVDALCIVCIVYIVCIAI